MYDVVWCGVVIWRDAACCGVLVWRGCRRTRPASVQHLIAYAENAEHYFLKQYQLRQDVSFTPFSHTAALTEAGVRVEGEGGALGATPSLAAGGGADMEVDVVSLDEAKPPPGESRALPRAATRSRHSCRPPHAHAHVLRVRTLRFLCCCQCLLIPSSFDRSRRRRLRHSFASAAEA